MIDAPSTPAWQVAALERLRGSVITTVRTVAPAHRSTLQRLCTAIDRHVFGIADYAMAPREAKYADVLPLPADDDVLVVWLPERAPSAELLATTAGGLLHVRHDGRCQSAEAACAQAILRGANCVKTEIVLHVAQSDLVLAATTSELRPYSGTLSAHRLLWKLAALVPRTIESLGTSHRPPAQLRPPADHDAHRPHLPARNVALSCSRAIATRVLYRRPWAIRVRRRRASPADPWDADEGLVQWRPGHMYADPFLFEHDGRHHLFCEEVPFGTKRGVISHTELPTDGSPASPPEPVLTATSHLSYPFVFTDGGSTYMIPETSSLHRVELYRATRFPHEWQLEHVILDDVDASDATLFAHDGRLWLSMSIAAPNASADEMHLYCASSLRGPWLAHPHNPVVSDARCARPAGAVQQWGSRLIRPAQDCSGRYGWAVSLREVTQLDSTEYHEHEVLRLTPDLLSGARAVHTYTADSVFEAIDFRTRRPRAAARWDVVRSRLSPDHT